MARRKRTNNDIPDTRQKTRDWATRNLAVHKYNKQTK